jgi:hypothetical protein
MSWLQACGMSEYVSIIVMVRRSVSRDDCVHTHEIMHSNRSIIRTPEPIWIILSIYTDSGTRWNTGWCAEYLDSKTHVLIGWRGNRPEPGTAEPFSHRWGSFDTCLGPGLLPATKVLSGVFHFEPGEKSPCGNFNWSKRDRCWEHWNGSKNESGKLFYPHPQPNLT